ncbi:MAG: hypothetical protein HC794_05020 [Nitrospiraceae bacterium]|nr:hypothetical protein [Nitrospiraceae bacterium]
MAAPPWQPPARTSCKTTERVVGPAALEPDYIQKIGLESWVYLTQVVQARAVELGTLWFRSQWPDCSGALIWQLQDSWPAVSWSVLDWRGQRKLAWYAARRALANRAVAVVPCEAGWSVAVINDTDVAAQVRLQFRLVTPQGRSIREQVQVVDAAGRSVRQHALPTDWVDVLAAGQTLLVVDSVGFAPRCVHTQTPDHAMAYDKPAYTTSWAQGPAGMGLRVEAGTLMRDTAVQWDTAQRMNIDNQMLTLLPGESHTFWYQSADPVQTQHSSAAPLVHSVNSLINQ